MGGIPFRAGRHLLVGPIRVPGTFKPHEVAFDLLKVVYQGFGVEVGGIPFRDSDGTSVGPSHLARKRAVAVLVPDPPRGTGAAGVTDRLPS